MGLTPDGDKFDFIDPQAIEDCWITNTYTPELAALVASTSSDLVDAYIIAACSEVNRYCNRFFNKQQADQIFLNSTFKNTRYTQFVLRNYPLISIDNVWIQTQTSFTPVSLSDYLQIDTASGIMKLIPDINAIVSPNSGLIAGDDTNIWIRYTSGYVVDGSATSPELNVPEAIKIATAMIVKYMFDITAISSGISSFKTQTYSQTNSSDLASDPKLAGAHMLLKRYVVNQIR